MSKEKARLEILSTLLSFPTINQKDWDSDLASDAMVGDLVSLCSAPASKWYMSWVREIKNQNGYRKYLLESIDDESLCWWSNVGVNVYNRKRVSESPTWQWDDDQFKFYARWLRVGRRNNAYIVLPCLPEFNDDGSVALNVRIRFGLSEFSNPKTFHNWKKLLSRDMDVYYKECESAHDLLSSKAS